MVKFSLIRLNITNWRINPLRKHLSILGQNDPGLREIFLEFNCGHFGKKIESLLRKWAWPKKGFSRRVGHSTFFYDVRGSYLMY